MREDNTFPTPDVDGSSTLAPVPTSVPEPSDEHAVLARLLVVAQAYRTEGSVWNAMDLFWKLAEDFPGTQQATEAQKILLEIASKYERDGARHAARTIYERFL